MIFIPGNVPSLKNSKRIVRRYDTNTPMIVASALVKKYQNQKFNYFNVYRREWKKMIEGKTAPLVISFYFIRDSKRIFDYGNASEVLLDMMKRMEWIKDDNMKEVIPHFKGFEVDPKNPGVRIEVL